MKLCIHKGARQVGGSCVEIDSAGQRLIIDLGLPLDSELDETPLPDISGLREFDNSLLGIAVSHAHIDHYGLMSKLRQKVPVLIGKGALRVIAAARRFFPNTPSFSDTIELIDRKPVAMGPFTVTPYLMDHSAYDAYSFLIEAEGKRVFYSGDFRGHGRKWKLFEKLVRNPPQNVNVLLMEGSTLGRTGPENEYPSEDDLESRLIEHFRSAGRPCLVWTSGQNIDRLVTIYRACRRSGKRFIADLYTSNILTAIGNPNLPQPGYPGFHVFVPENQRTLVKKHGLFDMINSLSSCRIFPEHLADLAPSSVMVFRPSMARDLELSACIEGAIMIYSLWSGYLKDEKYKWFHRWIDENQIHLIHCHTSGHAPIADLKRLAKAIAAEKVVPIHSFKPDVYPDLFANVEIRKDGEVWSAEINEENELMKTEYMDEQSIKFHLNAEGLAPETKKEISRLMISSKVIRCECGDTLVAAMGSERDKDDQINLVVDAVHLCLQSGKRKIRLIFGRRKEEEFTELKNAVALLINSTKALNFITEVDCKVEDFDIVPYGFRNWMRNLPDSKPLPALAKDIEKLVKDPLFRWYKSVTGGFWSGRVGGLEVCRVDLDGQAGQVNIGREGKNHNCGRARQEFCSITSKMKFLEHKFAPNRIEEVASVIMALVEARKSSDLNLVQREHLLESQLLSGAIKIKAEKGELDPVYKDNPFQFPTLWGPGGQPRFVDALMSHGDIPYVVELKKPSGSSPGQGYRHAITQAVLYREFIRRNEYVHPWFEKKGLKPGQCRAVVAFPTFPKNDPKKKMLLDHHRAVSKVFGVELVEISDFLSSE